MGSRPTETTTFSPVLLEACNFASIFCSPNAPETKGSGVAGTRSINDALARLISMLFPTFPCDVETGPNDVGVGGSADFGGKGGKAGVVGVSIPEILKQCT